MLMAAGLGTRLRPFTDLEPKALLPLLGVPMAQFALDAAVGAGVTRIVANVHHHASQASAGLEGLERGGAELILSDESGELLGSAGGLRHASPHFFKDEPFFLLNADVLCDLDLAALARTHRRLRARHGVWLTLAIFGRPPMEEGERQSEPYREIFSDAFSGLVTGLGEKQFGKPYFVGAAVIEPEALAGIPPSGPAEFVPTVLQPAISAGKAGAHLTQGRWHDVGSPELWLRAHVAALGALETGRLSRAWRLRMESGNRRVGAQTWVSRDVPARILRTARWAGPAYWNPLDDTTAAVPAQLGPRAVLYGTAQGITLPLTEGIGLRGVWTSLSANS